MKGVLTSFDFKTYVQYRDDMRGKKIKDVWGKEWDINDVRSELKKKYGLNNTNTEIVIGYLENIIKDQK